jgi:hypothetical protein
MNGNYYRSIVKIKLSGDSVGVIHELPLPESTPSQNLIEDSIAVIHQRFYDDNYCTHSYSNIALECRQCNSHRYPRTIRSPLYR